MIVGTFRVFLTKVYIYAITYRLYPLYICNHNQSRIWYNAFMDEKKRILRVIEKTDCELNEEVQEQVKPQFSHPNQTNPIYKKLMNFKNSKVGAKFSIKDLLR